MKRKWILLISVCVLFVGCGQNEQKLGINHTQMGTVDIVDKEMQSDVGYIMENQVFEYSAHFEHTYEWLDGVNMPFNKPNDVKIEFDEYNLCITDFTDKGIAEYLLSLQEYGFTKMEYANIKEDNDELSYIRYLMYKDNLIVIFDKYSTKINIYVTTGNVIGERDVSISELRTLLGEEYADCIVIEIANNTVYERGFCEFLVIPPKFYDEKSDDVGVHYVIASGEKLVLIESGMWNQAYPMTVNLIENESGTELVINYNDTPESRSGYEVYPELCKYKLEDGMFKKIGGEISIAGKCIINKVENNKIKYYILKKNEEYNVKDGRKTEWIIDKEYELQD